ncbi:hypothetical protein Lalb_Chr02g0150291 [Lupinus albus]|uniref:Uncharacterized protein n=1 Tax=Lupinus albus TaxID=3870 RepID=A0A6A4QZK7_LUPAL|nr:hypothetical protein Lalb_Chr02g0150291 [Lupinus albus]
MHEDLEVSLGMESRLYLKLGKYNTSCIVRIGVIIMVPEMCETTSFPLGSLTITGLICLYVEKFDKEEFMWFVAPLSNIHIMKELLGPCAS